MNCMYDQKKLIYTKLIKNKQGHPPGSAPGNHQQVVSSFNDQLMNQTNFGYNPARNTLIADSPAFDNFAHQGGNRQSLNTQRRNRTSNVEGTPQNRQI